MEGCKPCPFGYTSAAGAEGPMECMRVAQPCPPGQIAPPGAASAKNCACLPGYGGEFVNAPARMHPLATSMLIAGNYCRSHYHAVVLTSWAGCH